MDSTKPPRPIFCGFLTYEGLEEGPQWSLNYHTRVTSYLNIKHKSILYMSEKIRACAREEGSGGISDLASPLMHKAWKMFSASAFQALDLRMSFFFLILLPFLFLFKRKKKRQQHRHAMKYIKPSSVSVWTGTAHPTCVHHVSHKFVFLCPRRKGSARPRQPDTEATSTSKPSTGKEQVFSSFFRNVNFGI